MGSESSNHDISVFGVRYPFYLRTLPTGLGLVLVSFLLIIPPAAAQEEPASSGEERIRRWLRDQEVQPVPDGRKMIREAGEPLFRFVQVADLHYGNTAKHRAITRRVFHYVNQSVEPDWVVFTGDNVTAPGKGSHRALKNELRNHLDVPHYMIRGNHDAKGFPEVFGSSRWRFDYGGVQFIGLALDYAAGRRGSGWFSSRTIRWLKRQLFRTDKPAVVFLHEPIWPLMFLDAPRLFALLAADSDVEALVSGHLHYDISHDLGAFRQVVGPSVPYRDRHPIKEFRVYRNRIIIATHEIHDGSYRISNKYQEIPLSHSLSGVSDPAPENKQELSPEPVTYVSVFSEFVDRTFRMIKRLAQFLQELEEWSGGMSGRGSSRAAPGPTTW